MDVCNDEICHDEMVHPSKILLNGIPLDQLYDFGSRRRRYQSRETLANDVKRITSNARTLEENRRLNGESSQRKSHFGPNAGLLYVSNINFDVKDSDLYSVFGSFGQVVRAANNYGIDGHSNGTALIVFGSRENAVKAKHALNGQLLKGQNLSIRLLEPHKHSNESHSQKHFWADRAETYDIQEDEIFCYPLDIDSD